jgi:hypothetical protein
MSIAPQLPIEYKYVGSVFEVKDTESKVFKRVKNSDAGKQLADFIQKSNFGLVNLPTFSSIGLQNIQLFEDKPFGYSITVNFDEGAIYINPDYRKWDMTKPGTPKPIAQAPADDSIIAIADQFVKDHGIDTTIYGKPFIENKSFVSVGANGKTQEMAYDVIPVTYPLILDGQDVYDESGNRYGLQVLVDTHVNKVSSVQNLTSQVYESSQYSLQTDAAKILGVATSGPQFADIVPLATGTKLPKIEKLELRTPKRVLMRHFVYEDNKEPTELYVPALLFAIEPKKGFNGPKNIIVPLIKDAIAKINSSKSLSVDTTSTSTVILGDTEVSTSTPVEELKPQAGF